MIARRVRQLFQSLRVRLSLGAGHPSHLGPEDYPLLPDDWLPGGHHLYSSLKRSDIKSLIKRFPQRVERLRYQADRVIGHQFDLLGSGCFIPIDEDRPEKYGYNPINWFLDPVRNLEFPTDVHYKDWDLYAMRPDNADIKYPWELARCQHLPLLGQAFLVFKQAQYADEIFLQIEDFVEANPVAIGINWTCTMDVAIRALNWGVALNMIETSGLKYDEARLRNNYRHLFEHGHFIRENLEDHYEVTSNHYLSNIVGLFYLAVVFRNTDSGVRWYSFSRDVLEKEILVQVLEDGADFESSIPYHRLVTELFLGAARLAEWVQDPFDYDFLSILRRMINYHYSVLRPDGKMPIVGDCDDGRLHILANYGEWDPQDGLHLLGPAGFMFSESNWISSSGSIGQWEAAWWGYPQSANLPDGGLESVVALFPDAGVSVAKNLNGNYLLVVNSVVGTNGFGNHKHNDQLSFEYHNKGLPFFVDNGSYVYTSDFDARNRFRSSRNHNTLSIDGEEQNETISQWIFRLFPAARAPTHSKFEHSGSVMKYRGTHYGYHRFAHQATHQREFSYDLVSGVLAVTDVVWAKSKVALEWNFCCDPAVSISKIDDSSFILKNAGHTVLFKHPQKFDSQIVDAEVSFSYGRSQPSKKINIKFSPKLETDMTYQFFVEPIPMA